MHPCPLCPPDIPGIIQAVEKLRRIVAEPPTDPEAKGWPHVRLIVQSAGKVEDKVRPFLEEWRDGNTVDRYTLDESSLSRNQQDALDELVRRPD